MASPKRALYKSTSRQLNKDHVRTISYRDKQALLAVTNILPYNIVLGYMHTREVKTIKERQPIFQTFLKSHFSELYLWQVSGSTGIQI